MKRQRGFSLAELMVAMTVLLFVMLTTLSLLDRVRALAARTDSQSKIQGNVRVGMDRLDRDLRMIGFGVPSGQEVGATAVWTPVIFYASPTAIGFRGEVDGGAVAVTCTPRTSETDCPVNEIEVDLLAYFQRLNCKRPDNSAVSLPIVIVNESGAWEPTTCTDINTPDMSIDVSPDLTSDTFPGGLSEVFTVEQVYYRYVALSQPPYGRLERYVRYANTPDGTFPPGSVTWTVVADHLTDFSLGYRDAAGTVISGNPLSAADRALVQRIVFYLEGFESLGPTVGTELIQIESEVLIRNAAL